MINANDELHNLKMSLVLRGLSEAEADNLCQEAHDHIRNQIIDIVSDALEEAARSSSEDKTQKFISEIMAVRDGSVFSITTSSGKTDFSEPPFPMLPKLLSGAKVSKAGTRFKVIPVKDTTSSNLKNNTIEKAIIEINKRRAQLKAERDAEKKGISDPMSSIPDIAPNIPAVERFKSKSVEHGAVSFRTASENQDPNSKWVYPAMQADMTDALNDINDRLHDRIDDAIKDVISRYGGRS